MEREGFTAKQIGERIKERRTELRISMETLGKHLGVNKSTIQRYESKGIDPKKNYILVSVADALDTTVEWLTGLSDEKEYDIAARCRNAVDKNISAFIEEMTSAVPDELHQELLTGLLGCFVDMFSVFSVHFGNTMKEIHQAEEDSGLKESLMKYSIEAKNIYESIYRQRMEQPVEDMKQMADCLYHLFDKSGRDSVIDIYEICGKAKQQLKK
ncbi:MAG: helix-turn-helix transcriptional regulator [Oscillospiraceae bacterium]|nr:helix-turn-helix transcriptional regulator [Oscillospiraceae bacterium]